MCLLSTLPLVTFKLPTAVEGTSVPSITLIELTGLRNHYHPLIRKLIRLLESGSAFTAVHSYSKADGDFDAVVGLDERTFIEQELAKGISSSEISLQRRELSSKH